MRILLFAFLAAMGVIPLQGQPVIAVQPTNQVVFGGNNATFSATVSGLGPFTYQWQCNGTNLSNTIITTLAGNGNNGYAGDGGLADLTSLASPWGVVADRAGNVFIADYNNSRVRKVDGNDIISTFAGNGTNGFSGDGGAATNASLSNPSGLVVDAAGDLFIADYGANRVRRVDTNGFITTVAGGGASQGDGGPATNAALSLPFGLALDQVGNLYIADSGDNLIRKVDTNGIITTVAGGGPAYQEGNGGYATNGFLAYPVGVAVDTAGNLYIADCDDNMVRKVDANGVITAFAGTGGAGTGVDGDGGSATNAIVSYPRGVAVDALGNVYIAAFYDNRVRVVDTNGIINTIVGTGNVGYAGDNGDARNADFNCLQGLALNTNNDILVADLFNNRVRVATQVGPCLKFSNVATNLSGDYTVIVSNISGSVTSSVAVLTVVLPPSISIQPTNQQVGIGSNASFAVSCVGTQPLVYQWLFNGETLDGATNSSYAFSVVSTNQAGNYSVVVTNNYGSVTSSPSALTVLVSPPAVIAQPASALVPAGGQVTFSATAAGSPPLSYQWLFDGTALAGQTNASLALPSASTNQAGGYDVLVTSPYGSVTSRIANLTVAGLPVITLQPTNQTWLAGNRVVLAASVSGVGPLTFQWLCNGTNLPGNLVSTIAGDGTNGTTGDGGPATAAAIRGANALAMDGDGNLFVAGSGGSGGGTGSPIRKIDASGIITTPAGATNFLSSEIEEMATDGAGNLYLVYNLWNRVLKLDRNGVVTTVAGRPVFGFGGDGGPATNAWLSNPMGVCLDTNGNIYIADNGNQRIRKVDTNGIITTIAGNGQKAFAGDGGPATNASLDLPSGLITDAAGNLFLVDGSRIRKVDASGTITTVASNFYEPRGLAVDAYGDLFVADSPLNHVQMLDPWGNVTTVAGTNRSPYAAGYTGDGMVATSARFSSPAGLVLDNYGRLLIGDSLNYRVRRVAQGPNLVLDGVTATSAGAYTLLVTSSFGSLTSSVANLTILLPAAIVGQPASLTAGLGSNASFTVSASGTGPLAFQWQMDGTNLPEQTNSALNLTDVDWNDAGCYCVVVTNLYGCVTSSPATLTVGIPPCFTSQQANQLALAGTNLVLGVAVSGDGWFRYQWQCNGTNLPPIITTVAGTNRAGFSGDGGPAINAELAGPQGVAVDAAGNVFIADGVNNRIRKVDTNGVITTVAGRLGSGNSGNGGWATNATLDSPTGLIFDRAGNLYIAESSGGDVRKLGTNGIITCVAGTGTGSGWSGDGRQATNTFFLGLADVAFDATGNMYLCETLNYKIRKVDTNGFVSTFAGTTMGFSGDGGAATNAQFYLPYSVAADTAGNVLVADTRNSRVRKIDTSGIITTVAGTVAMSPYGVRFNSSGDLFVADSLGTIWRVDTNGLATAVAGNGVWGFSGDGGPATGARLRSPQAIAFDPFGNLYIADSLNERVRKVHFAGDPTVTLPNLGLTNSGTYQVVVNSPFGSVTSSNFTLTVYSAPALGSSLLNPDGSFSLNLSTTPNVSSRLYAATNLTPPVVWLPVWTNTTGGLWEFTDTNTAGRPALFYRVSTP